MDKKHKYTGVIISLVLGLTLFGNIASADDDDDIIEINLTGIGPGAGATGTAIVVDRADGPDKMKLRVEGLPVNQRFTVFLTHSEIPGALPAQFIGVFTTNDKGKGTLKLRAEIINAFASANQGLEDGNGIAEIMGAGALARGANTIPLNYIRGYFAGPGGNVFGPDESIPGGPIAFVSTQALP